ncbi:MAG: DNA mismatch repair protein MutS [Rhodobacteraceae bacterium]|nr:DNA mismatch repair protein MutS [Paracoccaceae bacterium]
MMEQYLEIKSRYPDALLFYRMGDFYELFFDDAIAASAALDIALTKRGKHNGEDIAMCGVPHHAAEGYLLTLIRKGFRVAVVEQLEKPAEAKKRGYKAIVKRDVVRLVTPGTLTEDSLLDARQHNYLAAIAEIRDELAVAWVDVSTGYFRVACVSTVGLSPLLARILPTEILVSQNQSESLKNLVEEFQTAKTPLSPASFDSAAAVGRLTSLFGVSSLDGFGSFGRTELSAMGAIVDYLDITQRGKLPLLSPPIPEKQGFGVQIDASTRRNLELVRNLSGGRDGALLSTIDRTLTGGGARLLATRLTAPSTDLHTILHRLDMVQGFFENRDQIDKMREALRLVPDLERALSRLALDRGGPRDMAALREALTQAGEMTTILTDFQQPEGTLVACENMQGFDSLIDLLSDALVAEPPLLARDGGFIASGFDEPLDDARKLRDEGRGVIAKMQAEYAATTDISALKIKHNNVLGYFIEVTAKHADKMLSPPLSDAFIHRQTTANAVRFTTLELSDMETRILNAGGQALQIEKRIFDELRTAVLAQAAKLSQAARALAEIDLATALALLAIEENWVRPQLDNSRAFEIIGGRHPVVETALRRAGNSTFIENDCDLSAGNDSNRPVWLLTGPNMAGKSTFLRQNAIIAILAQMGAYVPAASAKIGIIDQLFSRVGAADDLARGQSTFMVEMVETAAILNLAGDRALVILDEIGRGTATYDGLSIAWATLEHLHNINRCRTLFATHYHELTALTGKLSGLRNATVKVREWEGDVIFLHEVVEGAADRSYGVQVAKLAGLPAAVTDRARIILDKLEKGEREGGGKAKILIDDLPLFNTAPRTPQPVVPQESVLEAEMAKVHPDDLSPREALAELYRLRELLDK